MWTSEKKDNPNGIDKPGMEVNWTIRDFSYILHTNTSMTQFLDNSLIPSVNHTVDIIYSKISSSYEENYTKYVFNDTHYESKVNTTIYHAIFRDNDSQNYYLVEIKGEIYWLVSIANSEDTSMVSKYRGWCVTFDLADIKECWAESEIIYCT